MDSGSPNSDASSKLSEDRLWGIADAASVVLNVSRLVNAVRSAFHALTTAATSAQINWRSTPSLVVLTNTSPSVA